MGCSIVILHVPINWAYNTQTHTASRSLLSSFLNVNISTMFDSFKFFSKHLYKYSGHSLRIGC